MSWEPLNEVYFVRPDKIKGHELIPEHLLQSLSNLRTGVVVNVGTGTLLDSGTRAPLQANAGDRVLFGSKVGEEIEVGGEKLLLLAEANVLAVERVNAKTNI